MSLQFSSNASANLLVFFAKILGVSWAPLWPGCPPRGSKATPKVPFWAPLGLPWLPFGVTLDPSGLLFGSQWGAKGCQRAPMGLPSAPKRASYAFQRRSIWLSRAPKEVLKGSQGGCFNDGNCFPYCLGSRAGVIFEPEAVVPVAPIKKGAPMDDHFPRRASCFRAFGTFNKLSNK